MEVASLTEFHVFPLFMLITFSFMAISSVVLVSSKNQKWGSKIGRGHYHLSSDH